MRDSVSLGDQTCPIAGRRPPAKAGSRLGAHGIVGIAFLGPSGISEVSPDAGSKPDDDRLAKALGEHPLSGLFTVLHSLAHLFSISQAKALHDGVDYCGDDAHRR